MKNITERLIKFRNERNWQQFHTPENLSKSIVLEAAELLENYQWESGKENIENVKEELADIVGYCILLCEHYGFDLETIMDEKIDKNEKKYPVSKSYGKSDKYNKL